ncbi:hypothetical protein NC652_022230 [Populus alba x Populus x berolinensis]|nr:hypothetical protein NC652_022230 [Populus alba x Populus x berolinensis]
MVKKTMEGSLSFCFSIGVPSKTAVALLLMTYCLLIITTVGAASSLVVRLAPKLDECLVPEVANLIFYIHRCKHPK